MLIQRANVYRLEPTKEQESAFSQWVGACRSIYNLALEQRRAWGASHRLSYNQQQAEITQLRADVDWMREVPIHALQTAVRSLDAAYQRYWLGLADAPQPRKKFVNDSFTLPDPSYLGFKRLNRNRGAIKVPKVGWVKLVGYRKIGGELRSVTISRKAGHWFASIAWRKEVPDPAPATLPVVGIDRGVKIFAALSDGTNIESINAFKRHQDRLVKEQRKLARKIKRSANWKKQKAKITKLHHKIACARKDFLHKASTTIAKNHGVVKVEKLHIANMTRSAKGTVDTPGKNASTSPSRASPPGCLRSSSSAPSTASRCG